MKSLYPTKQPKHTVFLKFLTVHTLFITLGIFTQNDCLPYGQEVNYTSPPTNEYAYEVWQNKHQVCHDLNPSGYGGLSANWGSLSNGGNHLSPKSKKARSEKLTD